MSSSQVNILTCLINNNTTQAIMSMEIYISVVSSKKKKQSSEFTYNKEVTRSPGIKFTAYLCVSQQCCTDTTHIAPTVDQDSLHHPKKKSQRESGNNAQENLLHAARNKLVKGKLYRDRM
jgi:hypothetical protein